MKKRTKLIIIAASLTILLTVVTALATGGYLYPLNKNNEGFYVNDVTSKEALDALESLETPGDVVYTHPEYIRFEGKIIDINSYYENEKPIDGKYFVLCENEEGGLMNFRVDSNTVQLTENELTVGASVIGYYDATLPMIMIYPPQAHADVLAVDFPDATSVKVDRFDENLLSADEDLKLNIGEDVKLSFADGSAATADDLSGSRLAVVYTVTTRSIPAQTTPSEVIVLNESAAFQ